MNWTTTTLMVAVACAACTTENQDETASVTTAVTTVGGDGATYRLTPGARLSFNSTNPSGIPNYDVNLAGNGDITFKAVPGGYAATLYLPNDPPNTVRTEWTLERTVNGVTDTVNAMLVTPQGVAMAVTQNGPNNLLFAFKTTTGTIVFGRGTVGVTIGVSQASNYSGSQAATGVTPTAAFSGPYAAGLQALMPPSGTTLNVAIAGHMTGPWTDTGGTVDPPDQGGVIGAVCAPFAIDSFTGSGHAGLVALIAEADHGDAPDFLFGHADICVYDNGGAGQIWMRVAREGTADTVAFQTAFAPDNPSASFYVRIVADLPTRVFNSDTGEFQADMLLGTQNLPLSDLHLSVRDGANTTQWYNSRAIVGMDTFSFTAQ